MNQEAPDTIGGSAVTALLELVATAVEISGITVIAIAAVLATLCSLLDLFRRERTQAYRRYRANPGRGILLGLELLVGADNGAAHLGKRGAAGDNCAHPDVSEFFSGDRDRGPLALAAF